MSSFKGKTVIITGAASGIGEGTALAFANQGANVVCADINLSGAEDTAKQIGDRAIAVKVDVADMPSCQAMVDAAIEAFGSLDVIFNNAGIGGDRGQTHTLTAEGFQRTIDINVNGVFHGCKAALPELQKNGGGVIINTASIAGITAMSSLSAYVASKHAVIGITKTVALEYGRDNIRCVAVCPGIIETKLTATDISEEEKAALGQFVALGRTGNVSEIAELVLWLASDKASYVSGSYHLADGGMTAGFSMG